MLHAIVIESNGLDSRLYQGSYMNSFWAGIFTGAARKRTRSLASRTKLLRFELMEARRLLAANIYLDFGEDFNNGFLFSDVNTWAAPKNTVGPFLPGSYPVGGVDFTQVNSNISDGAPIRIKSLKSLVSQWDYDQNGSVNATDWSTFKTDFVNLISDYYLPFDVTVSTASASSTDEITGPVADSYVVLGMYEYQTSFGSWSLIAPATNAGITFGVAPATDSNSQTNSIFDTVSVFADNVLTALSANTKKEQLNALVYTASHEAGHGFGLRHTATPPVTYGSDLMTVSAPISQRIRTDNFFSRQPLDYAGGSGQFSPYALLRANVGANSSVEYFTGTSSSDTFVVSLVNGVPSVSVNSGSATSIAVASEVRFYGGKENDSFVFQDGLQNDSTGQVFKVYGGEALQSSSTSDDQLVVYGGSAQENVLFAAPPLNGTTLGQFTRFSGDSLRFNIEVDNFKYFSNGGSDYVEAPVSFTTALTVEKNVQSSLHVVTVATYGTSSAETAYLTGQTSLGAPGTVTIAGTKKVSFKDVDQVNFSTQGGGDTVNAVASPYQVFSVYKSMDSAYVNLAIWGSTGSDSVNLVSAVGTSGYANFGSNLKNVWFTSAIDRVNYQTNGGDDTIYAYFGTGNELMVWETSSGNTVIFAIADDAAGVGELVSPASLSDAGFASLQGKKPIYFRSEIDWVSYFMNGGNDSLTIRKKNFGATLYADGGSGFDTIAFENGVTVSNANFEA